METKTTEELLPFGSLALSKATVDALKEEGFEWLSPIQARAIPALLRGKNVLALSPTGTGKTLSYVVPIVERLDGGEGLQAILLSPTVALLDQVAGVFRALLTDLGIREDALKIARSNKDFTRSHPKILLTTPHLYEQALSRYDTSKLSFVVIDEGDMVTFDGFEDVVSTLQGAIDKGIVSFFSASLGVQEIKRVRKAFHIDTVLDLRESITPGGVKHHVVLCKGMAKEEALLSFLSVDHPFKAIVFVSTKEEVRPLEKQIRDLGLPVVSITGEDDKREIRQKIEGFKKAKTGLLLATDYVSRGIDVPDCTEVISADLPLHLDYYFHRAGRTGRFLKKGDSYILLYEDEENTKRARQLVRRGLSFDYLNLTKVGLKETKGAYQFRNLGKKDQSNEKLQKQIRHAVNKTKSRKVKPNYKKKVSRAVDIVKEKHRRHVVLTNIARKGGNARDFHEEKGKRR